MRTRVWRFGEQQRLGIGVDGDEFDALQAFVDHAIDGIAAAAADADDFDAGKRFWLVIECFDPFVSSSIVLLP